MADNTNGNVFGESSSEEFFKLALEIEKQQEAIAAFNKQINSDFTGFLNAKQQLYDQEEKIFQRQKQIDQFEREGDAAAVAFLKDRLDFDKQTLLQQQQQIKNVNVLKFAYNSFLDNSMSRFLVILGDVTEYINQADGAFKDLNKTIGLSGVRSEILRNNLIQASSSAAALGINFEDLTKIQGAYTETLGRAVLLSSQSLGSISEIATGTQMGAEQAGIMAAKFSDMGKSASEVRDFYQDTVNQSEKFGVSANAVIKKINDNLDKSQKYVFKNGVDGLKNMALYATKFKIDMGSVFNALDKTNSLEGAVDAVAQLQVLGGRFAAVDPFKLLYDSRNDAEAFTHTIQGLTKGMATFNKSTGEIQIAAGDLNRLKLAADATGVSYENLIEQAKRGKQIDMIDQVLGGGMSKEQREFIEGAAELQKGGSFAITMDDGSLQDIRNLSSTQIQAMISSGKELKDRAKDAMTFDKLVVNTMNELKSALLPILGPLDKGITALNNSGLLKWGIGIGAAAITLGAGASAYLKAANLLSALKGTSLLGGGAGKAASSIGGGVGESIVGSGGSAELATNIEANGIAAGGAWKNMLAFGAAVAEVGAGIWLATNGIASMADAFKQLSPEQLGKLNGTLAILGGTLVSFSIGMGILAPVLAASDAPLLAFGGAVALVGAGVGIAAGGIGLLAKGFGDMFEGLAKVGDPKVTDNLGRLMMSLTALSGEALLFANPLTWLGLKNMSSSIEDLSDKLKDSNFQNLTIAATSFDAIANAIEKINDKKLDKLLAVSESLGSISSIASIFGNLANSLGDGIEVKFSKDKVNLEVNVTTELDGVEIGKKISRDVALSIERSKKGSVQ